MKKPSIKAISLDDHNPDEEYIYVSMPCRLLKTPSVGSHVMQCHECGCDVWVSQAAEPWALKTINCVICAIIHGGFDVDPEEFKVTPNIEAELQSIGYFGGDGE